MQVEATFDSSRPTKEKTMSCGMVFSLVELQKRYSKLACLSEALFLLLLYTCLYMLTYMKHEEMPKDEEGWKEILTPEEYEVLREKGTEPAFSGIYEHETANGTYTCRACGNELFSSDAKYDAGCGWPSFFASIGEGRVTFHEEDSLGMERIEVRCAKCGSHLGHIFDDGPKEHGGKRFCINSIALDLDNEDS